MKIQSLTIIFIIIIMPITMVLSEYVTNRITCEIKQLSYDTKLLDSTYDAIKAYQLNTINNQFGDVTNETVSDIEASVATFYNSLSTNFNYKGYKSTVMKEYVPAVVYTLYDGYYIYSPYTNVLTEATDTDDNYSKNGETYEGLKPYVSYSVRYKKDNTDNTDFVITYTLDNYVTIQGTVNDTYIYDYGYLYTGIEKVSGGYEYNGVTFSEGDTECLKEFIGDTEYKYVKINGKKYYLDELKERIFYIDKNGEFANQVTKVNNESLYNRYINAIEKNKSAYEFYKNAFEFSKMFLTDNSHLNYTDKMGNKIENGLALSRIIEALHAIDPNTGDKIFKNDDTLIFSGDIEEKNSNFNKYRKEVIRYVIESNLKASIAGFSSKAGGTNFLMPKISDTDWELIENNVCAISFLQGLNLGNKKYNGYAVVKNSLNRVYVSEDSIYLLANDVFKYYCKVNDKSLVDGDLSLEDKGDLKYYPGLLNLDFELRQDISTGITTYYFPNGSYGAYTSIMGSTNVVPIGTKEYPNIDSYLENLSDAIKKAYYVALCRERWGAYNVNNQVYGEYALDYFLKDYE